ncbi:MAG TPA: PAS domain S-box protein [Fimbriimonas sp.]|nr:PAS domain S-box protein [Fimbriimonas sp.]
MSQIGLPTTRLSDRENKVLDLAVQGLTDQQIAQNMAITPATVNSYWVRIRGKLGHLSRTELVGAALRSQAKEQMEEMRRQFQNDRTAARKEAFADSEQWEIFRSALDILPDAVFICDESANFVYANQRMLRMFDYQFEDLIGRDIEVLFPHRTRHRDRSLIARFLEDPGPLSMGIDRVVYGMRRNGLEMRILLSLNAKFAEKSLVVTGVVRNFMEDVDVRRRNTSAYSNTLSRRSAAREENDPLLLRGAAL